MLREMHRFLACISLCIVIVLRGVHADFIPTSAEDAVAASTEPVIASSESILTESNTILNSEIVTASEDAKALEDVKAPEASEHTKASEDANAFETSSESSTTPENIRHVSEPLEQAASEVSIETRIDAASAENAHVDDLSIQFRAHNQIEPLLDRWCMDCICQASSGCEAAGCGGGHCGPYQLSWEYWADAGKPNSDPHGDPRAFQRCALNKTCAESAVMSYMSRYRNDCNRDGVLDCQDFARIHKAGPHNCGASWVQRTPFWDKFLECQAELDAVRPPHFVSEQRPVHGHQTVQPFSEQTSQTSGHQSVPGPVPQPAPRPTQSGHRPISQQQGGQRPEPQGGQRPQPQGGQRPQLQGEQRPQPQGGQRPIPQPQGGQRPQPQGGQRPQPQGEQRPQPQGGQRPQPQGGQRPQPQGEQRPQPQGGQRPQPQGGRPQPQGGQTPQPQGGRPQSQGGRPQPQGGQGPQPQGGRPQPQHGQRPQPQGGQRPQPQGGQRPLSQGGQWPLQPQGGHGSSEFIVPENFLMDRPCLQCICQALSGCDSRDCNADICGPFQITKPYWIDAGRPGDDGHPLAWQLCALNSTCAEITIQRYMVKFSRDCNEDARVNCWDFARIHKAGPYACGGDWITNHVFWKKFVKCASGLVAPAENDVTHGSTGGVSAETLASSQTVSTLSQHRPRPLTSQQPANNWDRPPQHFPFLNVGLLPPRTNQFQRISAEEPTSHDSSPDSFLSTSLPPDHTILVTENDSGATASFASSEVVTTSREQSLVDNSLPPSTPTFAQEVSSFNLPNSDTTESQHDAATNVSIASNDFTSENRSGRAKDFRSSDEAELEFTGVTSPQLAINNRLLQRKKLVQQLNDEKLKHAGIATTIKIDGTAIQPPADRQCLDCICKASTNCVDSGCALGLCGPYQLSIEYWSDAGKLASNQQNNARAAFESCAVNRTCAEDTVQAYLGNKWRDCDGNGVVNCWDFARIHKAGGDNCHSNWVEATPYWAVLRQCLAITEEPLTPAFGASDRFTFSGQNQVPPGLRKPPFIVVPPESERLRGSASENVEVVARPQFKPSNTNIVPPGHPPLPEPPNIQLANTDADAATTAQMIKIVEQNLDRTCLTCLCEASSSCERRDCIVTGPEQYFCGPYHISWAYWADAGKPNDVPGDAHAFERCLKNFDCSERTVFGYMAKFGQDCNGDGRIDCSDFARIHKAGPFNCNGKWVQNTEYWQKFDQCWSGNGNGNIDLRDGVFGK